MVYYLFLEVESNLPENIKDRALSVFKSAVSEKYPIIAAIEKVQKDALCEIETVFKGQRFKVGVNIDVYDVFMKHFRASSSLTLTAG